MDLAAARYSNQHLQQLGALSLWRLDVVPAIRLGLGGTGAVGLGALSLRPLGQLQQLLGLVSAHPQSTSELVASGAGGFFLDRHQLWFRGLLVPAFVPSARSALPSLRPTRSRSETTPR